MVANVDDLTGLGIARHDLGAQTESRRLQIQVDEVECGRIDLCDLDGYDLFRLLERHADARERVQLAPRRLADTLDRSPFGIKRDFDRPFFGESCLKAARRLIVGRSPVGQHIDALPLVEQVFDGLPVAGSNCRDGHEVGLSRSCHGIASCRCACVARSDFVRPADTVPRMPDYLSVYRFRPDWLFDIYTDRTGL